MRTVPWLLLGVLLLGVVRPAGAEVVRFGLVLGNDLGEAGEEPLRFAEDDARKFRDVLGDLGGFAPENLVVLLGEDATTARRALISLNERIRMVASRPGMQVMLLVYYSGHADAEALHLGTSPFQLAELEQLVRGSAASFRVLVLDACRSGALTRVKGGTSAPPFFLRLEQQLTGEGVVFLTSSAASESAQESEALRGSFFTHYLVSGLLGAADQNRDGRVVLEEAYQYAYENTLRASSRTLSGTQHPTFRYELKGQGDIVLTDLGRRAEWRGSLEFPPGRAYLLFAEASTGPVVAEVGAHDRVRRLTVRAGRYFVRGRGPDFLVEGPIVVAPSSVRGVEDGGLERLEYARLVRKGASGGHAAHGIQVGYQVHSGLWREASACQGPWAAWSIELEHLSVVPRVGACRGGFRNAWLSARVEELGAELRVLHAWDLPRVTVDVGASLGAVLLHESFTTRGQAPDRTAAAGTLAVSLGATYDLPAGLALVLNVAGQTYLYPEWGAQESRLATALTVRGAVGLARRW
jgi:hypothetical protein